MGIDVALLSSQVALSHIGVLGSYALGAEVTLSWYFGGRVSVVVRL